MRAERVNLFQATWSKLTDLFQSSIKSSDFLASEIGAVTYFVQTESQSNLLIFLTVARFRGIGFAEVHIGEVEYARLIATAVAEAWHDKYHLLISRNEGL